MVGLKILCYRFHELIGSIRTQMHLKLSVEIHSLSMLVKFLDENIN
jgi:hypothetical protein